MPADAPRPRLAVHRAAGRRFFAFLYLYEPHAPYTRPPAHRDLALPYDGEITYADELVGRFVGRLRGRAVPSTRKRSSRAITSAGATPSR